MSCVDIDHITLGEAPAPHLALLVPLLPHPVLLQGGEGTHIPPPVLALGAVPGRGLCPQREGHSSVEDFTGKMYKSRSCCC